MKTTTFGKYFMLSFLTLGLALSSCKKEEDPIVVDPTVTEPTFVHVMKQIPTFYKHTGETCYYCGAWGWPLYIGAADGVIGNAFTWGNYGSGFSNGHFRGEELNATMQEFQDKGPSLSGKPSFVMNGAKVVLQGTTVQDAIDGIISDVATENAITDIDATAAFNVTWDGDKLKVSAQTKFHKSLTGEYYMGVYVVENKARGDQSGPNGGTNVEHHYVMRGSMSSSAWGEEILNGTGDSGSTYEKDYEVTIPSSYVKNNLSIGVIIWKKNGVKYKNVNAATNQ